MIVKKQRGYIVFSHALTVDDGEYVLWSLDDDELKNCMNPDVETVSETHYDTEDEASKNAGFSFEWVKMWDEKTPKKQRTMRLYIIYSVIEYDNDGYPYQHPFRKEFFPKVTDIMPYYRIYENHVTGDDFYKTEAEAEEMVAYLKSIHPKSTFEILKR